MKSKWWWALGGLVLGAVIAPKLHALVPKLPSYGG